MKPVTCNFFLLDFVHFILSVNFLGGGNCFDFQFLLVFFERENTKYCVGGEVRKI